MEEEILKKIGLTANEAKIYLALLKLGPVLVSKIADETKLNRTYVYDRLKKLLEKGLVSYVIKSGKKYFKATSPDKLLVMLEEKERQIKKQEENLKKILPKLQAIVKKPEEIDIEVFKSKEGLKTLLQDILKEKKEINILGFTGKVAKTLKFFYPHFQNKRIKLGIKRKIIADYKMKDSKLVKQQLTKTRFLPKKYHSPAGMWLYADKTVIFLPEELIMILIKSKRITKAYKNYFELLWKTAEIIQSHSK